MKNERENQLQYENKCVCNDILERNFYENFRRGQSQIEIYLTGRCRQTCEYCYIHQHGKELYPSEICNTDTILRNLQKTLEWYIQNRFTCKMDLFSAEWIPTKIAPKVMEIFYNTFKDSKYKPDSVGIPDNMSWIENDDLTAMVQKWIDDMASIGIGVYFSASVDGKYCEDVREPHTDEFYEKLFAFMEYNRFDAHPMLSSQGIEHWIDNIEWWWGNAPKEIAKHLYLLEVRDNSWTDDKIQKYIEFLDYLTDVVVTQFVGDDKESKLLQLKRVTDCLPRSEPGHIYGAFPVKLIPHQFTDGGDLIQCTLFNTLVIRMGDMAVPLCHRLSYDELLIGKFNQDEEGNILDFEPRTGELLIFKSHLKLDCAVHCESCPYVGVCQQYCVGAAYEAYSDLFVPPLNSCKLQYAKYRFLITKYYNLGLFDYIDDLQISSYEKQYLKDLVDYVINTNGCLEDRGCGCQ